MELSGISSQLFLINFVFGYSKVYKAQQAMNKQYQPVLSYQLVCTTLSAVNSATVFTDISVPMFETSGANAFGASRMVVYPFKALLGFKRTMFGGFDGVKSALVGGKFNIMNLEAVRSDMEVWKMGHLWTECIHPRCKSAVAERHPECSRRFNTDIPATAVIDRKNDPEFTHAFPHQKNALRKLEHNAKMVEAMLKSFGLSPKGNTPSECAKAFKRKK
jgi:hypothetical protein